MTPSSIPPIKKTLEIANQAPNGTFRGVGTLLIAGLIYMVVESDDVKLSVEVLATYCIVSALTVASLFVYKRKK
jgi:hypothetical protein